MKHSTELREWLTANAKIKHRGTFLENDCKRGLSGLRARRTQSEGLSELVDLEREVMLREEKRKKEARVLTAEVNRIKRAAQRFKQQLKYVMAGPKHAQPPAQAKKRTPRSLISQSAVAAPSEGQGQKTEDPAAPPTIESLSEARLREETEELRRRMEAVEDGLLAFKTQRRVEYSEMQEEEEQLSEELSSLLIRFEKEDAQEKEDKRRKITPTLRRAQSKTGAGVGRKSSRGRKEFIHTPSPTPLQKSYHNSKSRDNTIGNGANAAFETPVPTVSGHALTSLTLSTPQTSRKSKTRSLSPSSPSLSPSQATQQEADELEEAALPSRFESEINVISGEVRRIDQWIAQHGGPSGGWSDDDHAHYLRLCSRTSSRRVLLQRMCSELMDVSVEAATRHAEWHTQYLDHTHRKKQLLQQWKKYKQKEEELRIEEQGKKDQQRRIEAARVRKERMAQEKKRNAELIRKWKEKKKMEEMADEALKKAKAFDAKRVAREKADKEKKRVQELMALYRQQQEEEELAKQAAEKVQAEEARVRARAQKAKEAELLEEQKHRLRTVAEKKAREKATKEREAQKEQARRKQSKTHIVVPRDPSRLTKATKIQLLRAKQKKEEEKAHSAGKGKQSLLGRVSGVSSLTVRPLYAPSRLASVSWRRGM